MNHESENEIFSYSFSAKQQEEIKRIREKYIPKEETTIEQLRRLDAAVTKKGTMASLVVGIVSALIVGVGICCCMVWADTMFVPGIVIGLVGMAGVAAAYPIYAHITKKERERIAPIILRMTDELMK